MKLTLGEKLFLGPPALVLVVIVVDATYAWTAQTWLRITFEFVSGYFMWTVWENRHVFRRPHEHTD